MGRNSYHAMLLLMLSLTFTFAIRTPISSDADPLVFFGVDYYPEQWPIEMIEFDLYRIKHELGADVIRIGEFSWHLIEPQDGYFEFGYWDNVLELAKDVGLKVMFGTPTATVPAWLAKKHPEILSQFNDGRPRAFGGRRQYSFNSRIFRQYASRVTNKLLQRYGGETNIFSWQIDNELGHEGSDDDYSPSSASGWHTWLGEKYDGNITDLNHRWGNIFWSQTYNNFNEIPMPVPTITQHNPSLLVDWRRFRSDSIRSFLEEQASIVRRHIHPKATVTTNFPGGYFAKYLNFAELGRGLDYVSYDNYPVWGGLEKPLRPARVAFALDLTRGILPATRDGLGAWAAGRGGRGRRHFVIAEQLIGAQGHNMIGYLPRPGEAAMWSIQALLHGATGLMFFRWRSASKGQEVFCYGVQDSDNVPKRRFYEAKKVFSFGRLHAPLLAAPVRARVAVLYSYQSVFAWQAQLQSKTLDPEVEAVRMYEPFWRWGIPIDVLDAEDQGTIQLISRGPPEVPWVYDVLILPTPISIPDTLYKAVQSHVEGGGSLWMSFRADLKDKDMVMLPHSRLASLAGVKIEEFESLGSTEVHLNQGSPSSWNNDAKKKSPKAKKSKPRPRSKKPIPAPKHYAASVWRDMLVPQPGVDVIYRYSDPFYEDYAAVTRRRWAPGIGDGAGGEVVYVGCGIDTEGLIELAKSTLEHQELLRSAAVPSPSGQVEVIRREDASGRSWIAVVNYGDQPATWRNTTVPPFQTTLLLPPDAPGFLAYKPPKYDPSCARCLPGGLNPDVAVRLARDPEIFRVEELFPAAAQAYKRAPWVENFAKAEGDVGNGGDGKAGDADRD
ncbi:hypothetical protein AAMO2058_000364900 [Amorphochlora amoebiformis]